MVQAERLNQRRLHGSQDSGKDLLEYLYVVAQEIAQEGRIKDNAQGIDEGGALSVSTREAMLPAMAAS